MSFFEIYKPGQAKSSRTVTFLCGAGMIVWGARQFTLALERLPLAITDITGSLTEAINVEYMEAPVADRWVADLVIFESPVSIALILGALIMVGGLLWWFGFLNKPKWADLLIEMEAELRKVSWPTQSDAWQSTLVVTLATAILVGVMWVYDAVILGFIRLFVSA